jgi:hypothetical protein
VNLMYPQRPLGSPNVAAFVRAAKAHFAAQPMADTPGRDPGPAG